LKLRICFQARFSSREGQGRFDSSPIGALEIPHGFQQPWLHTKTGPS